MMLSLDDLLGRIRDGLIASGTASGVPVAVTNSHLIRSGHDDVVLIPLDSVSSCETWNDTHRWGIRLVHTSVDRCLAPCDADLWWRWHDRRKYQKELERLSRETVLTFSRGDTAAARALQDQLRARGVACRAIPSPVRRDPRARAILQRVE